MRAAILPVTILPANGEAGGCSGGWRNERRRHPNGHVSAGIGLGSSGNRLNLVQRGQTAIHFPIASYQLLQGHVISRIANLMGR